MSENNTIFMYGVRFEIIKAKIDAMKSVFGKRLRSLTDEYVGDTEHGVFQSNTLANLPYVKIADSDGYIVVDDGGVNTVIHRYIEGIPVVEILDNVSGLGIYKFANKGIQEVIDIYKQAFDDIYNEVYNLKYTFVTVLRYDTSYYSNGVEKLYDCDAVGNRCRLLRAYIAKGLQDLDDKVESFERYIEDTKFVDIVEDMYERYNL